MNKKFNIILLGPNFYGEIASSSRIRNLFEPLLPDKTIEITNLVINSKDEFINDNKERIHVYNLSYKIYNPVSIIKFYILSARLLKEKRNKESINVFYCYGYPSIENFIILLVSKLIKYKIVFEIVENADTMEGGTFKFRIKNYTQRKLKCFIPILGDLCFAISHSLVDFCSKLSKRGKIDIKYLPVSVNVNDFKLFKKKRNTDSIEIFYAGSFAPKDGLEYLIAGFEGACAQNSNIRLILTGQGKENDVQAIVKKIENSPHKNKIKYMGYLPTQDYYQEMVNADILCMTRINSDFSNAGFPFKLGEYLASGNAVIATNVSDISKYLVNNENAIIINPNSSEEIKNAILLLSNNIELRNSCGMKGRKVAEEFFDANKVSNILINSILNLV